MPDPINSFIFDLDGTVNLGAAALAGVVEGIARLRLIGLPAQQVLIVGDGLETDIFMGQQAGMQTVVTLTGVTKRDDVAKMTSPPDYIIQNLGELPAIVVADYAKSERKG